MYIVQKAVDCPKLLRGERLGWKVKVTLQKNNTVFAENLVLLCFLWSVSYIKPIPTHEKLFAVGKRGPDASFNPIFLGLGWPWVGEFVGFIVIFISFPTQQRFVNRKHPNERHSWYKPGMYR